MRNPLMTRSVACAPSGGFSLEEESSLSCQNPILVTIALDSLRLAHSLMEADPHISVPLALDLDGSRILVLMHVDYMRVCDSEDRTMIIEGLTYAFCSPDFGFIAQSAANQSRVRVALDDFADREATGEMVIEFGAF